ncbi:sorbosone dehydrogenase family protein [Janthinobacterium agaricidamnosum]|uniref:Sorbosone dehydrogenase family protein n=1 Tax=Janthinobacterium agaricidamnosum TaxID=55508 RepID=A0A3G2EEZ0_9BURK|nr:sorbosone dehydrogenase family protein [Janthinobacterium agaricidamnosum]AYM78554.1 sorbosone dehydrogenase family protein [Janthinobacterium agaricidamnosum]
MHRYARSFLLAAACGAHLAHAQAPAMPVGFGPQPTLPAPDKQLIPTVNVAPVQRWTAAQHPAVAAGLAIHAYARDLDHPRWLYVLPNGDVLVAETNAPPKPDDSKGIKGAIMQMQMKKAGAATPSANRITLLRGVDANGVAQTRSVFLQGLNSPFGMALVGNELYIANADALMRFPYKEGQTAITAPGVKVMDLPGGPINHHWTKNVIASPDGKFLYVSVGSNSNVGENGMAAEDGRAAIWQFTRATGKARVYATGLRNPVGLAWQPRTGALWTAVNERDELGNDLVPDYMTSVKDGAFYGWPYSYFGQHVDARVTPPRPELVATAVAPDYALGAHTASLGLAFYDATLLPERYRGGAFIGQHGSWNRKPFSGYKVIFVPFADGVPSGPPQDVVAGFLDSNGKAQGRPVGVAVDKAGALLVADDVGNVIWRVTPAP